MKFNEIYKLIITLSQIKKCYQKLEKSKSADAIRELMHQHEMLLKTDSIMIRADRILSNAQKAESDSIRRKNKNELSKKKESLKTQFNNIMIIMIDDLIKKMKALALQIIIISETVTNQARVFLLQRFNDALTSAFLKVSRLKCFDYDKSDHSTVHCSSINIMCDKRLVYYDINNRLC